MKIKDNNKNGHQIISTDFINCNICYLGRFEFASQYNNLINTILITLNLTNDNKM